VQRHFKSSETVSTVSAAKQGKPVETVFYQCLSSITGLKPGVNERAFITGLKPGLNERAFITGLKPGLNEMTLGQSLGDENEYE
jgi:hypothetical protein